MEAKIDRSSGISIPNFGILTRDPLVYFIDIINDQMDQRFVCQVDVAEFEIYCEQILKLNAMDCLLALRCIDSDESTDWLGQFLNEKSKDWRICNEDNEIINQ